MQAEASARSCSGMPSCYCENSFPEKSRRDVRSYGSAFSRTPCAFVSLCETPKLARQETKFIFLEDYGGSRVVAFGGFAQRRKDTKAPRQCSHRAA
jgi:hypothetical protein